MTAYNDVDDGQSVTFRRQFLLPFSCMVISLVYHSRSGSTHLPDCGLPANGQALLGVEKLGLFSLQTHYCDAIFTYPACARASGCMEYNTKYI